MSDITTVELVKALRTCASPIDCDKCPIYDEREDECDQRALWTAAASRLEQQERRISELERIIDERKQKYAVLDTEAAEMRVRIYELERQIETDRAEWEPIWANRCDMQRKRVLDLERALAAVKEDLHHNDACSVCIGADQEVCKDCDLECQTCVLDCRCKDCRDESKWEWRGAREGEGK